jgi:hypothetical protein
MSLINLRYLPKNSFISLIIPYIQTFQDDFGLISEKNITFKNNKFNLNTKSSYNYSISELNKTTVFYTHITSLINNQQLNIHERITIKCNSNNCKKDNYLNYSINIVNNKPVIYSIKCIEQPMAFDLMNHYTDDIKEIYNSFK